MIDLASPLPASASTPDARALLAEFARTGRQAPFEEVVRRYSGMVLNVCMEVTGNRHDAEDAMQAAFLSLAVQVKSGNEIQAIGPWLQQVARRMSLDINRSRRRRKTREDRFGEMWEIRQNESAGNGERYGHAAAGADWEEFRQILQAELESLPAKYRLPLILHYYGGMSREEMAKELNVRANTLGVRLHRAREMLGKKLAKRGITMSAVVLGVYMVEVVRSIVGQHVVESTAHAAAMLMAGHSTAGGLVSAQVVGLAKGATRAIGMTKMKLGAMLAMLAGGAMAASAEVISRATGISFDLKKIFRPIFKSDLPATPMPINPIRPIDTPKKDDPPAHQQQQFAGPLRQESGTWVAVGGVSIARPSFVEGSLSSVHAPRNPLTPSPVAPRTRSSAGPLIVISPEAYLPNNSGLRAPSNGGGGGGGGDVDVKTKSQIAKDEKEPRKKEEDRGGVKHPREDDPRKPEGIANEKPVNEPVNKPQKEQVGPKPIEHVKPPVQKVPTPLPPPIDTKPKETQESGHIKPSAGAGRMQNGGGVIDGDRLIIESSGEAGANLTFDLVQSGGVGSGMYWLRATSATHQDVMLGYVGTGVVKHSSGVHVVDNLSMGVLRSGKGMYRLGSGELLIKNGTEESPHRLTIGGAGEGLFLLGDDRHSAQIGETGDGVGSDLVIGKVRTGSGELRGWGSVKLSGALVNNGQVIADGYGQDRTLDMTSFTAVRNDFAQRGSAPRGWYAKNGGRLDLPVVAVALGTATYTWGDTPDEYQLDMVNSARVTLGNSNGEGQMNISLLATDRSDVPSLPGGHTFIGVWSFSLTGTSVDGVDLLVRYDDALAAQLGLDESVLKLWTHEDGAWIRHDFDASFVRDGLNHTLSVHLNGGDFDHFAVSAPEPGTVGVLVIALSVFIGRRRRRPV